MKKLSKPMLAIFLAIILLLSTTATLFAGQDSDPIGNCMLTPKLESIR